MELTNDDIRENLRELLGTTEEDGTVITQAYLGQQIDRTQSAISMFLSGKDNAIASDRLQMLCDRYFPDAVHLTPDDDAVSVPPEFEGIYAYVPNMQTVLTYRESNMSPFVHIGHPDDFNSPSALDRSVSVLYNTLEGMLHSKAPLKEALRDIYTANQEWMADIENVQIDDYFIVPLQ